MRLFVIIYCLFLFACNNNGADDDHVDLTKASTGSNEKNETQNVSVTGCYLRVMQRDTLVASLVENGKLISGKLTYDNFEKDGSSGSVSGVIENNTVKLLYRFQSEGMNSIAEVYFKITPNGLIHGFGDIRVKGDSTYYADTSNISYPEKDKLIKVACSSLPAKYQ